METPEFYQAGNYYSTQFTHHSDAKSVAAADHFVIDDLLNYPNDDVIVAPDDAPTDSSNPTVVDSCNSSFSGNDNQFPTDFGCRSFTDAQFSSELCVPYDDVAELEWLSNFVEDSFSSEEFQKLQLISGVNARPTGVSETRQPPPGSNQPNPLFRPEVPGKARSKRSRAAPGNWASRLLVLSPTQTPTPASSDTDSGKKSVKAVQKKKDVVAENSAATSGGDGRKCLHCATDKTPQWRTGPMGPKTLCNACGVRYKSGRLVPEYRPAASPTFVLTKHSNSHRKVVELRRQKEVQRTHNHQHQFLHQSMMFEVSNGDDYLIHQHIGPDYRHMM